MPFSLLLMLGMPGVLALLAPGMRDDAPTFAMAVEFGRITFPYLLFISLASLYGGVLNSIDRFAHVAATPILLNLALIGAVLGLTPLLPNSGYAASIGVAIAGLLQWLWLLIACARDGVEHEAGAAALDRAGARLVRLATPVAIGGGVQQISTMLDVVWASLLPVGTISALYYADRIAQLPLGVVGIAIGTALLPLLARQLRAGQTQSAMANQNRAIEFGLLFSLPAALALWLLADPMIRVLFEHGRFGPDDTLRTASALAAYAVGLPAFVLVKALTPGFFAREDTRTPLYIAIAAIVVNIVLNIVFLYGTTLAQVGIALASSLSGWLNAVLLAVVLRRRGHWVPDERLVSRSLRMVGATVGMGAACCGWRLPGWRSPWRTPTSRASSPCLASAPWAPSSTPRWARSWASSNCRSCASCCAASPASRHSTQANNRDAGPQRPVRRGHHQHAIVVGRRHRLAVVVAQHGARLGDQLLTLETPRRREVAALGGDGMRHLDDPLLGRRRLLPAGRQVAPPRRFRSRRGSAPSRPWRPSPRRPANAGRSRSAARSSGSWDRRSRHSRACACRRRGRRRG